MFKSSKLAMLLRLALQICIKYGVCGSGSVAFNLINCVFMLGHRYTFYAIHTFVQKCMHRMLISTVSDSLSHWLLKSPWLVLFNHSHCKVKNHSNIVFKNSPICEQVITLYKEDDLALDNLQILINTNKSCILDLVIICSSTQSTLAWIASCITCWII